MRQLDKIWTYLDSLVKEDVTVKCCKSVVNLDSKSPKRDERMSCICSGSNLVKYIWFPETENTET